MQSHKERALEILARESGNGNKEAFREIFDRLSGKLFAYLVSRTSSRDDALDVTQEVFIELWNSLSKFKYRSEEAFMGFIFIIAKRKLYRYYRVKPRTVPLEENTPEASYELDLPDTTYLMKYLNSLASHHQDLLKLRYWSGLTFGEIASALGITENTAKVWHHRAIKKLQLMMEKQNDVL